MTDLMTFLEGVLRDSGEELRNRYGRDNHVREKKDASLVTDADIAVENLILTQIRKRFPDDGYIAEESGRQKADRRSGSYVWVIDPLDGTTNFANGYPYFCTSIARCRYNDQGLLESVVGGVHDPMTQKFYLAEKGHGAFLNGTKMKVHDGRPIQKSFLVSGFYYGHDEQLEKEVRRFYKLACACQSIRRDGASALDLALVAAGVFDGFWERELSIWDIAAGCLLVTEAGGSLMNYPDRLKTDQDPYDLEGFGLVAGSKAITQSIFELLKV
jgi:myo-inositol-1(or 4)-monophosphatase